MTGHVAEFNRFYFIFDSDEGAKDYTFFHRHDYLVTLRLFKQAFAKKNFEGGFVFFKYLLKC